jgi:CheY-like chemotaxis protein
MQARGVNAIVQLRFEPQGGGFDIACPLSSCRGKVVYLVMKRVLVVEDEMLVAMLIEDMLTDLGYEVVGPAARLSEGLELASGCQIDAAVLDINLAGELSFPIADLLEARGIPFIFASGYGARGLNEVHREKTALSKPFQLHDLALALSNLAPFSPST